MRRGLTPVENARELAVGDRLGRYELIRELGFGGMAEVHLARATGIEGFQKLVVLKRILPHLARDETFIRMFLAEAKLAAMLDHHNIAQVFDLGRDEEDYYFVMEYVDGVDVRQIMRAAARHGGLPYEHAVAILIGTTAGLHFAHECKSLDGRSLGIVHRDVSPTNVLVNYEGCVKVVDFGVAKVVTRTDVTQAGTRKGKVPYMSPEQCQTADIDARSDVFSAGILLWECTTGKRLFRGDNEFSVMHQIVNQDAPPPSTVSPNYPAELEKVVMKALERDRNQRYQSAREMQRALEGVARQMGWRSTPSHLAEVLAQLFPNRKPPLSLEYVGDPGPAAAASDVTSANPREPSLFGDLPTATPSKPSESAILEDKETVPVERLSPEDLSEVSASELRGIAPDADLPSSASSSQESAVATPSSYRSPLSVSPPQARPPSPAKVAALVGVWIGTLAAAAAVAAYVVGGDAATETLDPPAPTPTAQSATTPSEAAAPIQSPEPKPAPKPVPVPMEPLDDAQPKPDSVGDDSSELSLEDPSADSESEEATDEDEKKGPKRRPRAKKKKKPADGKEKDLDAFTPY